MNLTEKQLEKNYVFEGKIIKVRKDLALMPNGKTASREVVEHNGGVCIAPLTENNELIFVKQFRYPYMEEVLELPAGKRDSNEEPKICGIRELKEETGATAKNITFLGKLYPSPGYCGEIIWLYLATGLDFGKQNTDEDEFLEVYKIPLDKAVEMVLSGEIKDAKTQTLVLKIKLLKDNGILSN
ncbi:MAG: NUDIX hydrolase [Ruminococcaceae bacterium]|nr:NUDIX hydrolase [Oscillospiraceae bacterium]